MWPASRGRDPEHAVVRSTNIAEAAPSHPGISVIAADAELVGDVSTPGDIRIEGRLTGNVRAAEQLLVAPGGRIDGEIDAAEAVIGGEVVGPVRASRSVTLQASAQVFGTITTPRISVEEGAAMDVDLGMTKPRPIEQRGAA